MTQVLCATHGHCFDGLVSAALFTDLIKNLHSDCHVNYRALGYGPQQGRLNLDGELNALLDYRYVAQSTLHYYVDHHATAFLTPDDRDEFDQRQTLAPTRFIYDEKAPSCATLVAQLARTHHQFDSTLHRELEKWANKIDAAQFDSVQEAIDLDSPLLRVVNTVTHFGDHQFYSQTIPILLKEGVLGLSEQRTVKDKFRRLRPAIESLNRRIKSSGTMIGRVAWVNLMDEATHVVSKFRQYFEFPDAAYSVILHRTDEYLRLSVGYNPWSAAPCDVHIGQICQQFGGGGHAVVGAIGLSAGQSDEALTIAEHIIGRLQVPEGAE
jgi:hypothetical protein